MCFNANSCKIHVRRPQIRLSTVVEGGRLVVVCGQISRLIVARKGKLSL